MVRRGRGRRRKRRRGPRVSVVSGRILRPPVAPPEITAIPWNSITLSLNASPGLYTTAKAYKDLQAQLSVLAKFPDTINIRVRSVRAWLRSDTGLSLILGACDLISPSGTKGQYLATVEDACGKAEYARVGYTWPLAHQAQIFDASAPAATDASPGLFYVYEKCSTTCADNDIYVLLSILWKPDDFSAPNVELRDHQRENELAHFRALYEKLSGEHMC